MCATGVWRFGVGGRMGRGKSIFGKMRKLDEVSWNSAMPHGRAPRAENRLYWRCPACTKVTVNAFA